MATKTAPKKDDEPQIGKRIFVWCGPVEGVELKDGKQTLFAGTLIPGRTYGLPEAHRTVQSWLTRGYAKPAQSADETPEGKDA